jgi:hypothetical protein
VLLGESNEKNVIIEKGLESGNLLYLTSPLKPEKFKLTGEELIPVLKEREKARKLNLSSKVKTRSGNQLGST